MAEGDAAAAAAGPDAAPGRGCIQTLLAWARAHGALLHPSVQVYRDARTGLSFRVAPAAAAPLPALEPVVSVPTALTLSYLDARAPVRHRSRDDDRGCSGSSRDDDHDCSGSSALPEAFLAAAPPHVVGRVFLVREYLRGRDSFWWPYIQALPRPDDAESWALPPFWCAEEAELLEGTNVEIGMDKIRSDVRREHADALRLLRLCDEPLAAALTATLYRWAYCVFSSRSFRPSLVLSESQQRRLPPGVSIDHFSVLFPLFDIGNHDMTTDIRWDLDDAGRSCELRVDRPHAPGQQIFNNYSMKTNAELLLGYGFMVPAADDLHNDYTHVRKRTTAAPVASDEYLISLRPVAHPSSLLARTKQTLRLDPSVQVLGAFQHLQPDMVWDIFCTLAPAEQHEQLIPAPRGLAADAAECHRRNRFFSGQVEGEGRMYLEQTMALIQHKVLQELERLNETDVELVGGNADLLSRNQKLALDYRERCRRVLENTLESMSQDELPADVVDGH